MLRDAHRRSMGGEPSAARLGGAWAHLALENGRGRRIECNNIGNLTHADGTSGDYYRRRMNERRRGAGLQRLGWRPVVVRFRAYPSPVDGAMAYWRLLTEHYARAVALFDAGEARRGALNLVKNGYATAEPEPYAAAIQDLYGEYRARIHPLLSQ